MLMYLGIDGVSSDESDHENATGMPQYLIVKKPWRNPLLGLGIVYLMPSIMIPTSNPSGMLLEVPMHTNNYPATALTLIRPLSSCAYNCAFPTVLLL